MASMARVGSRELKEMADIMSLRKWEFACDKQKGNEWMIMTLWEQDENKKEARGLSLNIAGGTLDSCFAKWRW